MKKGTNTKYTIENIHELAKEHGTELLSQEYKNCKEKLQFRCSCGEIFETSLDKFINRGQNKCTNCLKEPIHDRYRLSDEKVREIISSKGCEWVGGEYINATSKLQIKCCECGDIYTKTLNSFQDKRHKGLCIECVYSHNNDDTRLTPEYVKSVIESMGVEWISGEYTSNVSKLTLKCSCGEYFVSHFNQVTKKDSPRTTCIECSRKGLSKGEKSIKCFLDENNINYKMQFIFSDCVNIKPLPFDFAIFKNKEDLLPQFLIEFDGGQHFKPIKRWGGEEGFKVIQYRDSIKDDYCRLNNIPLLRIPYTKYTSIDSILQEYIAKINDNIVPRQITLSA